MKKDSEVKVMVGYGEHSTFVKVKKGADVLDDALAIVGSQAKDSKDIVERWI